MVLGFRRDFILVMDWLGNPGKGEQVGRGKGWVLYKLLCLLRGLFSFLRGVSVGSWDAFVLLAYSTPGEHSLPCVFLGLPGLLVAPCFVFLLGFWEQWQRSYQQATGKFNIDEVPSLFISIRNLRLLVGLL